MSTMNVMAKNGWIGALAATLGVAALAGAGAAGAAPSVVGMTYDKASEAVQSAGAEAEVSSVTGTALPKGECIVTNQVIRGEVIFGRQYTPSKVLLSLNCNATVASPGHPGNSVASPQGREAKKQQEDLEWRASPDGQAWCVKAEEAHPEWFPVEGCPT
jgi:hypothetical protein